MKHRAILVNDPRRRSLGHWAAAAGVLLMSACGGNNAVPEADIPAEFPVITLSPASVTFSESYTASIRGRQDVEIFPQVSGTISRVCVTEGERVSRGQLLFVIDQVPYQAALKSARANVQTAQAQVDAALLDLDAKRELLGEEVISEHEFLLAKNALASARAVLEQARAGELEARNNLSYTEIKSPVDGVVGTLPYKAGALAGPAISTPLTTVSDNTGMHVYFSMTENELRSLMAGYATPAEMIRELPDIRLQLSDGSLYGEPGRVASVSGVINPQTGTLSIRSVFPNPDGVLWSGGIGKVVIPHCGNNVIVIPQTATLELQDRITVYKVINGTAVATAVKVHDMDDGRNYVVTGGLHAGDTIVSEGVGKVKDGGKIKIKDRP